MTISPSEQDDFEDEIRRAGRKVSDFELKDASEEFPTQGVGPVTGSVIIRNTKSGVEHTYETGHSTAWVVEFHDDLHAGKYD
jgi:hypothetical protein